MNQVKNAMNKHQKLFQKRIYNNANNYNIYRYNF